MCSKSYPRDLTGELRPETCIAHFVITHCVRIYTANSYIHHYSQRRLRTKLTHLMTAFYTLNVGFTANDASFYKNEVG